jgi:hypothetical protein
VARVVRHWHYYWCSNLHIPEFGTVKNEDEFKALLALAPARTSRRDQCNLTRGSVRRRRKRPTVSSATPT